MNLGSDLEYDNLAVWFDRKTLHAMVRSLVEAGVSVTWKESPEQFHLLVNTTGGKSEWSMQRVNGAYKLQLAGIPMSDSRVAAVCTSSWSRQKGMPSSEYARQTVS